MRGLLRDGGRALDEGGQVVIFPEGTRVYPGHVAPLQPGIAALASHSKLGVIPVLTDSGVCWGRGMWAKRPGVIHIHILPMLPPGLKRPELMARLTALFEAEAAVQRARLAVDNSVH
jgi:1-acyl-sn-glycerol-3-phosphate acyltransferase